LQGVDHPLGVMMMPYTQLDTKQDTKVMPDLEDYLTTEDAAKKLGFHVKSIRYMVYNGTLEGLKVGRSLLVSKKSIKEYLEKTSGMSKNDPRRGKN